MLSPKQSFFAKKLSTGVCRPLHFHAYLSTCHSLILRLIQCKWNFLAVLYRTQVSVDEKRFAEKSQFAVIYSTSYTFPDILFIAVGYFMMVGARFTEWFVDSRVENIADVNTSSEAERRLLSSVLKEYAAGLPLCLIDLPNKNTNIAIICVNTVTVPDCSAIYLTSLPQVYCTKHIVK